MPTLNDSARNGFADAMQTLFGGGSLELLAANNDVLCTITLPATAFGAADAGVASKSGTWSGVGSALASTGTACTQARFSNGGATMTMTAGAAASSPDLVISNDIDGVDDEIIIEGNPVTCDTFTYTHPAS